MPRSADWDWKSPAMSVGQIVSADLIKASVRRNDEVWNS
jgi:hypothetical protein